MIIENINAIYIYMQLNEIERMYVNKWVDYTL